MESGPLTVGSGRGTKKFSGPPSKCGQAKNVYTKSERLSLSFRVTWVWSERVHLYSRQIMTLQRGQKHTQPNGGGGAGPLSGSPEAGNLYRLSLSSALPAVFQISFIVV